MDIENLQQNMNTRVVFREPRGMIRWLQLFFAIIALSTVADFYTTIGIDITCPPVIPITSTSTTSTQATPSSSTVSTPSTVNSSSPAPVPNVPVLPVVSQLQQAQTIHPSLVINYPFDFSQQKIENNCPGYNYAYTHMSSLNGSPQFFVMTGVLALIYAAVSLVIYLFFSSTYDSVPVWPVADLIIAAILCLFWFIASTSFSSGVSLLKSTVLYGNIEQVLCPTQFKQIAGANCTEAGIPSWKSLNVGLVSGYTSFFLWGTGLWFVYKETHFHTPRDSYGLPR